MSDDAKLCYLVLYDEYKTFKEMQSDLFLDSTVKLHRALRKLSRMELIYSHPLLTVRKPTRDTFEKLRSLNLEVLDKSPRALLWATSDDTRIIHDKPASYYKERLKALAKESKKDIEHCETIRELLVDESGID